MREANAIALRWALIAPLPEERVVPAPAEQAIEIE